MPRVSLAIQTHELRSEMAADLNECLGGRADLVFDPEPNGYRSPWRTYRRALETTPADATHRLVVQDDVLVCDHFAEAVELAVAAQPDRVLLFFVAGHPLVHARRLREAQDAGRSWVELDLSTWIPAVAALWPTRLIEPFLSWHDAQNFPRAFTADDEIIGRWLRVAGERPLATVPSLVEHPDTVPSVASGNRRVANGLDPNRRAALWIGDLGLCDGRAIDWQLAP